MFSEKDDRHAVTFTKGSRSQLRGYGLPDHRDLWKLAEIRMFCEVTLIGTDNAGQRFLHGNNIPCRCPHLDRFRHSPGDIVHLQFLVQRIEESIRNRFNSIQSFLIPHLNNDKMLL